MIRLCLVCSLLLVVNVSAKGKLKYPEDKIPVLNVPRLAQAPTCDGTIEPDEWRHAVKLMGVVSTGGLHYRDRPVSFWVGWDAEHLYIAARSDILPGHRLWRGRREKFTTGVVYDDSYEFGIFMYDRNQPEGEASSFLKIILNSLSAGEYMKIYPSIGQNMYNWQPSPEVGARVHTQDGTEWFDLELALDLEDLQAKQPNKAGDPIGILLAGDLKNPGWQWLDFPSASGHLQHYGFPRMTLTAERPFVHIEQFSGLHDEKVEFRSEVRNPGPKPVQLDATMTIVHTPPAGKGEPRTVVEVQRRLSIPAGKSTRFDVSEAFPGLEYAFHQWGKPKNHSELRLEIRHPEGSDLPPVYTYTCQFAGTDKSYLKATPRLIDFACEAQLNPATNQLFLTGDTLDAKIPEGSQPAAMRYDISLDGKPVATGTIDLYVNYKYEGMVQLEDPKPGKYEVTLALVDAAGKVLIANTKSVEKKDEAQEFAEWWGNDIGDTERILEPFEPIRVDGAEAAVTRRVYTLDALGLPRQIESNGGPVLTAPARLVVTVGGEEHIVPTEGTVSYTSQREWRTEFRGESNVAGIAFSVVGAMEQDGLVALDLTYAPTAGPIAIEDLRIEWPVDDTHGNWMSCIGGVGGNYAPRTIDRVPAGEGQVWDTLSGIGKAGSTMLVGNWQSNLWVGNDKRGLCWFGDDDQGWVPTDETPAHSLARDGQAVVIRNHIIRRPKGAGAFQLDAPRTINIQYNATPFRHLAKGWRLTQVSAANGFSAKDWKYDEDEQKDYFTILSMPSKDKAKWPYYLAKYKKIAEAKAKGGLYSVRPRLGMHTNNQIALRGYGPKTREPGLYQYFGADWSTERGGESLNASYRDYMLYLMDMHVREGALTHYYFDISFTRSTPALAAGFGYRLPDGRVQPGSMDGPLREWYKRVWALMQEHDLYPGAVSGHATHSIALRALPWTDAVLDSEYPITDAVTIYPKDAMIAMSCPHNFGVNISHLGPMKPTWASLFDAGMGGGGGVFNSPQFRHFGITAADVEFLPFWRNQKLIEPADDGVLASAWKRPGKLIIQVLNYGLDPDDKQQTRSAALRLDLHALGVPTTITPDRLRIRELALNDNRVGERDRIFDWYDHLYEKPRWKNDKEGRIRPPAAPTISTSGLVDGVHLFYHDSRFLLVTWDAAATDREAVASQVGAAQVTAALDWGLPRAEQVKGAVTSDAADLAIQAWQQPGTAMIVVHNPTDAAVTGKLEVDLARLGVKVEKLWSAFTQLYEPGAGVSTGNLGGELSTRDARFVSRGGVIFDGWNEMAMLRLRPGQRRLLFIDTH